MSRKRHDNRQQRPSNLVRFIHPLWLDTRRGDGGRIVVRIWGRSGAAVELLADAESWHALGWAATAGSKSHLRASVTAAASR